MCVYVVYVSCFLCMFSNHFSYTFERVQENSEKLWRFQRYTVINDYDWRIPSPLNIAFLPYRLLCCPTRTDCCLHWCKSKLILRYLQRKSLSFLIFYSSTFKNLAEKQCFDDFLILKKYIVIEENEEKRSAIRYRTSLYKAW